MTQGLGWRLFESVDEARDSDPGDKAVWLRLDGAVLFGELADLPDTADGWAELSPRQWAYECKADRGAIVTDLAPGLRLTLSERMERTRRANSAMTTEQRERLALETGLCVVSLRKEHATWYWFTTNPQGGGFGSHHAGSRKVALRAATMCMQDDQWYWLVVNDELQGKQSKRVQS